MQDGGGSIEVDELAGAPAPAPSRLRVPCHLLFCSVLGKIYRRLTSSNNSRRAAGTRHVPWSVITQEGGEALRIMFQPKKCTYLLSGGLWDP